MRIQYLGVSMETLQHGIVGNRHIAHFLWRPFVGDALQLGTGNGDDSSVTRMKIHLHLTVYHFKVFQIGRFGKLVFTFHIDIIHQDVFILTYQFESSRTFHRFRGLLLVVGFFLPLSRSQWTGSCYPDAVSMSFGFIKQVVDSIFIYDITVYARFLVFRDEKRFRFTFQVGKFFIGISIINHICPITIFHWPINQVFSGFRIEDSLRSPYPFQFFLAGITFLHIDDRMVPVHQVCRFQQHHGTIGVPSIVRNHIGNHHIECLSIFATQDMRVAHATGRTDDFGINDRFVVIQCPIGISVRTYRIAYGFLADVVTCKIGKEISYVIFFGYIVLTIGRLLCSCQPGHKTSQKESKDFVFHNN